MRFPAWPIESRVAGAAAAVCLGGLIAAGVGSAAPATDRPIVFASRLPAYPLPDNFEQGQLFSIELNGRGRYEINPSPHWIWSRDFSRIYFTRDTPAGAEVWAERADGRSPHFVALLSGSGAVASLAWSPDSSQLVVTADALWLVGADGSDPRAVFTVPAGTTISELRWSRDETRITLIAGDLWSVAADGSGATRLFHASGGRTVSSYDLSPDGQAVVVTAGDTWLVPAAVAPAVDLTSDEVDGAAWTSGGDAVAVEAVSLAACGLGSTKCAEWYQLIVDRSGARIGRIDNARDAAWSPDGRRLAFESGPLAVAPEEGTIDIANRDGTGRRTVSRTVVKADDACWSFPGWTGAAQLRFEQTSCNPDEGYTTIRSVIVAVPSGRLVRSIASTDVTGTPSPDGKLRAYLRASGNDVDLYVSAVGTSNRIRLSPRHGIVDEVDWSPDGRSLAFTFGNDDGEQIYLVAAQGGRPRQVTHEPGRSWESGLTFTNRGRRLRYDSEVDPLLGNALWTMNPDGAGLLRLTHEASDDSTPAWSPDGRRVAFSRSGSIAVIDGNGRSERRLTAGPKDTNPVWSPDGKRIAFRREIDGTLYLAVVNADGSGLHVLRNSASPYGRQSWSPDGREIVYSDSGTTIMSIAPDGTHKHALLATDCTSPSCTWFTDVAFSPDGTRIAVACNDCDPSTPAGLWVMGADGRDLTLVAAVRASSPSWSPDGRTIVFASLTGAQAVEQIYAVDADGSHLNALTAWPVDSFDPSWSPR